jgi:hypothetical protein
MPSWPILLLGSSRLRSEGHTGPNPKLCGTSGPAPAARTHGADVMGPGYLKLKSLEIRNFRGVTPASGRFCLESTALSAGINLVYGANGSGKTTMAKAMEVLLWADKTESRRAFLSSTWTAGSARMGINCIAGVRDTTFAEGGALSLPYRLLQEPTL